MITFLALLNPRIDSPFVKRLSVLFIKPAVAIICNKPEQFMQIRGQFKYSPANTAKLHEPQENTVTGCQNQEYYLYACAKFSGKY
jgi:hypothetical protein